VLAVDSHLARFYRKQAGYEPVLRGRFSRGLGCYRTRSGEVGVYAETAYLDLVRESRQSVPVPRPEAPKRTRTVAHGLLTQANVETNRWEAVVVESDQRESAAVPAESAPQGRLHGVIRSYLESCGWFWVEVQSAYGHVTSGKAYDTVNAFKRQVEKEAGHRVSLVSRR
jgi:hypothetical protein